MHYKFIWYCFLVIIANTLLQFFLTINFTGRIKKKTSTSTGSSDFVAAPESGLPLPLSGYRIIPSHAQQISIDGYELSNGALVSSLRAWVCVLGFTARGAALIALVCLDFDHC